MVGFSSGIATLLVSAVMGGVGLPFGVPPAPEDPILGRVAPENCLFYLSWAGTASPDLKSPNQTEQLLAEPEVQNFLTQIGTALRAQMRKSVNTGGNDSNKAMRAVGNDVIDLLQHVSLHPGAIFVGGPTNLEKLRAVLKQAKTEKKSPAKDANEDAKNKKDTKDKKVAASDVTDAKLNELLESDFEGGIILAMSPDAAAWNVRLKKAVETLIREIKDQKDKPEIVSDVGGDWHCNLPKNETPFRAVFGFHGDYLVAAWSERSYKNILARMKQEPPRWWSDISKRLPIDRRSVAIYADLHVWSELGVLISETTASESELHDLRVALEMFGLSNARAWIEVWGLDGRDFAKKSLLLCDGEPAGLLRLISDQPLKPEDLAPIPSDAVAAAAFRFDAQQAMEIVLASLEKMDPKRKAETLAAIEQAEKALGMDLRHSTLKSLGDTWCIYSSPSEGYWPTAVVSLRDWAGMNLAYGRLMELGKQWTPASDQPHANSSEPSLPRFEQFRFADNDVYCLNFGTYAPAWCMTKREMVLGFAPQSVKAYLTHDQRHEPIQRQPAIADLFTKGNGPTAIAYFDSLPLFRAMYGFYGPLCGPTITNMMRSAGVEADLSLMPSAPSLYRHISPGTTTLRRTKYGIELISRCALPMPSMTGYFALAAVSGIASNTSNLFSPWAPPASPEPAAVELPAQPAPPDSLATPSKEEPKDISQDESTQKRRPRSKHRRNAR